MQKRALIAMQYSALHNRTWKTPTVQKPCTHGLQNKKAMKSFDFMAFFGAMEGTRTPGLLIRRNPEAIFIHSEFYDDSKFLTFCRYFRTSLPLYSLHCLHLCASIFQFSDVQKMCKNVQRLLMLEKIGIQLFLRASNSMHLSPRTVSFSS